MQIKFDGKLTLYIYFFLFFMNIYLLLSILAVKATSSTGCWYSCQTCSEGNYDSCVRCISDNRGVNGNAILGTCFCGSGSTYQKMLLGLHDFITECKSETQNDLIDGVRVLLGFTGVLLLVNFFGAGSHTVVFHSLDTLQIIGLLGLIDVQYGYPFSEAIVPFKYFFLYTIFPNAAMNKYTKEVPGYNSYADVPQQPIHYDLYSQNIEDSPNLRMMGYSFSFLLNAWLILVLAGSLLIVVFFIQWFCARSSMIGRFTDLRQNIATYRRIKSLVFRCWSFFLIPLTVFIIWQLSHPSFASVLDVFSMVIAILVALFMFCAAFIVYEIVNNQFVAFSDYSYRTLFDQIGMDAPRMRNYFLVTQLFKFLCAFAIAVFYRNAEAAFRVLLYSNLAFFLYTGFFQSFKTKIWNLFFGLTYAVQFILIVNTLQFYEGKGNEELKGAEYLLIIQVSLQFAIQLINLILLRNVFMARIASIPQYLRSSKPSQISDQKTIEMESTRKFEDFVHTTQSKGDVQETKQNGYPNDYQESSFNSFAQNSFDFNVINDDQIHYTAKRTDL